MKEIIERLEQARKKNDWSYEKLAEVAGVAKGNVFKTLTGKSEPAAGTLFKIAEALNYEFFMVEKIKGIDWEAANQSLNKEEVVMPENGKQGKIVILKARQTGKASKIAETVEEIKKQSECSQCTYNETKSGIRFVIKKCEEHKTKKK